MKILHVIDNLDMGGAQSLLLELLPVQKCMGHNIVVLELRSSSDRVLSDQLIRAGISVISLSKNRSERNLRNIIELIPYISLCDIVHVHLFPANYWTAIAKIISFSKTPIVTTEHSTTNKRRNFVLFKYIDNWIYQKYQEVIACSDKTLETFQMRFPKVNCISIPNGVNIIKYFQASPYSNQDFLHVENNAFITTMVARFNHPKRQDTLVKAIALLPQRFHAVFVGGAPSDEGLQKIKKLSIEFGVFNRVHFLYIRSDVPRILKSSNAIVMSSEYEGLSLSSIEGMASGKPFVASDVNGLREIVQGAGELFSCGDETALAEILSRLDSDSSYYNRVVDRCLKRALQYDIQEVARRYVAEYEKYTRSK